MKQLYRTLIIDDHPIIIEGYTNSLRNLATINPEFEFKIDSAINCDSAMHKLKTNEAYDLVILDISLPPSVDRKILSGEDIGRYIRQRFEKTKIVIFTMYTENFRLNNIFKTVQPDGLLCKSDITSNEIMKATKKVLHDPPYYSNTVLKLIKKQISSNTVIDYVDRQILFFISNGLKMKDLPGILLLSIGTIEKRKRTLHIAFNTNSTDDASLINKARETGFI